MFEETKTGNSYKDHSSFMFFATDYTDFIF